jgi:tetratricopeptide (TPR) repeat protein
MYARRRDGKRPGKKKDEPLPQGWWEDFSSNADLEKSFEGLKGWRHFHALTMRGRIRSLQLRMDEAWKWFDKAYERSEEAPETIPNLVRQFLLNIYCFEHALLEAPLKTEPDMKLPEIWVPELPEMILREYPEVKLVIGLRRQSEAILRLHLGEYETAISLFEKLIEDNSSPAANPLDLASHYLGLAAAQHNMGLDDLMRFNLENAALAIQSGGETLNRARQAAVLHAFYTYLEDREEAAGWKAFVERLPCPQETRELFVKRANVILERCTQQESLLLI